MIYLGSALHKWRREISPSGRRLCSKNKNSPKCSMSSTLLLVPTQSEWDCFSKPFLEQIKRANVTIELCGFGPIASAIRTTQLITRHNPDRVMLVGIAGALAPKWRIGTAIEFDDVICFGIGAGSGDGFQSAGEMGWSHWHDPKISDMLPLATCSDPESRRLALLTCCAASADDQDVQLRLRKYGSAIAEDMEGFSVAAACTFTGTPLRIIRGISNLAGDRNKANWRVHAAMAAVEESIQEVFPK